MKLYSYVLRFDSGFAPNPFGKHCTLATCKPRIRKTAKSRDWVIGTGSAQAIGDKKLIYAMQIKEKLEFPDYWKNPRFTYKKPQMKQSDLQAHLGDNIYWRDANGIFHQEPSLHSNSDGSENKKLKEHDLNGQYVLVSENFFYFGLNAVYIPKEFHEFIKKGPGHKSNFTEMRIQKFLGWLESEYAPGSYGDPELMLSSIRKCHQCIEHDGTPTDDED